MQSKNVGIINAAPLSMGLYSEAGAPDWHMAPGNVKVAAREAFVYCKVSLSNPMSKNITILRSKWINNKNNKKN